MKQQRKTWARWLPKKGRQKKQARKARPSTKLQGDEREGGVKNV